MHVKALIEFLTGLEQNNNRPWFQKHKHVYDESAKFPMQCLIASLSEKMGDVAPEIQFNPKKSIFRIYRDIRFSKNKAPYKTNIAAAFNWRGIKGPFEPPGLYLHIAPGEMFIGGGVYMPSGDQLNQSSASELRKASTSASRRWTAKDSTFPTKSGFHVQAATQDERQRRLVTRQAFPTLPGAIITSTRFNLVRRGLRSVRPRPLLPMTL